MRASHFKSLPEPQNLFYTSVFPTFWLPFTLSPSTYTHTTATILLLAICKALWNFLFPKKKKTVLVKTLSLKTLHYTPEEAILISPRSGGHVKNGEGPSEFLILVCFPELVPFQLSIPSHFPHPRSSRILWPRPGSVLPVILALRASPFWGKALFYLPSVAINPNSNIP